MSIRVIIHIGEGKTGSSSIQHYLGQHGDYLKNKGILYLPSTSGLGQNHITHYLRSREKPTKFITPEWQQRFDQLKQCMNQHCKELASNSYDYLILSGEHLVDLETELIHLVLEKFIPKRTKIESVNIICYLRNPISLYLSIIQQNAKSARNLRLPQNFLNRNLSKQLAAWALKGKLEIRKYDRSSLLDGCVVKDFTEYIKEITHTKLPYKKRIQLNKSLKSEPVIAIYKWQRNLSSLPEKKIYYITKLLYKIQNLEKINTSKLHLSYNAYETLKNRLYNEYTKIDNIYGIQLLDKIKSTEIQRPNKNNTIEDILINYNTEAVDFFSSLLRILLKSSALNSTIKFYKENKKFINKKTNFEVMKFFYRNKKRKHSLHYLIAMIVTF